METARLQRGDVLVSALFSFVIKSDIFEVSVSVLCGFSDLLIFT